nr:thioredoxin superfamily protein [Tanacetum cinerariifolium]
MEKPETPRSFRRFVTILLESLLFAALQKGLGVVALSSNSAVTHPQARLNIRISTHYEGPDFMAEDARLLKYLFRYLYDHEEAENLSLKKILQAIMDGKPSRSVALMDF